MVIQGEKVILRNFRESDFESIRQWRTGDQAWKKLDAPYFPKSTSGQVEHFLENLKEKINANDFSHPVRRMVVAEVKTDAYLGEVAWYWQSQPTNWISIGATIFDPDFWGKGIGTEALALWCAYLFEKMPELVRLDLRTWSGNQGMMRVAEKLGFKLEARFRNARVVEGKLYDGMGYGILIEEWRNGPFAHLTNKIKDV